MTIIGDILKIGAPEIVVEAWYEANREHRTFLGLSEIGNECGRVLWYTHNGYGQKPIDGRILRLFKLGDNIEQQVIIDLITAGYKIWHCQREVNFEYDDLKLLGHIDGKISGLIESSKPHILEIKSSSNKRFQALKKLSSYERWDKKYKCQLHVYMLGSKLKNALVWVENKDTSEVYTERVKLDRKYAMFMLKRAFDIMKSKRPPERKCPRPDWYEAKWCKFYDVCF